MNIELMKAIRSRSEGLSYAKTFGTLTNSLLYTPPEILVLSSSEKLFADISGLFPNLSVRRVNLEKLPGFFENWNEAILALEAKYSSAFLELNPSDNVFESCILFGKSKLTSEELVQWYEKGVYYISQSFSKDKKLKSKFEKLVTQKCSVMSQRFLSQRLNHEFEDQKKHIQEQNDLLQMAVHDLRSPLSAMVCYSELLMDGVLDSIKGTKVDPINIIHQNCEFLIDMVDDLLDSAQLEAGKKSLKLVRSNFTNIILKVVRSLEGLARVKDIDIITHLDSIPDLFVDPQKMERIVINLLGNAIKFTKAKGTIVIKCTRVENNIVFSIQDTGPGIPEKDLENIFEKFNIGDDSKISGKGHGLGLAITKSFVEMHGGKIFVKSERHKGSTFIIHLRVEKRLSHLHRDGTKKILFLDAAQDIPDVNSLVHIAGAEVEFWDVKQFKKKSKEMSKFASVIINEKMDFSTIGHKFFHNLENSQLKHRPWFFLFPSEISKDERMLFEYLNIHVLIKPLDLPQLVSEIEKYLTVDRRKKEN